MVSFLFPRWVIFLGGLNNYINELKTVRAENPSNWIIHDQLKLVISSFKEYF